MEQRSLPKTEAKHWYYNYKGCAVATRCTKGERAARIAKNRSVQDVGEGVLGASKTGSASTEAPLLECISSTLKEWSARVGPKQEQEVVEVSPCERPCKMKAEDRDELKITAKIFLLHNQPGVLKEAIEKVSAALGVARLDTVMMALPHTSVENDPLNEHLKASWLELQQLVAAGSVASIGTSDLDVSQLESLYHWAEV
uniref:glutamate--cysteine ligase regulatory subunit n=1 Tax=Myxine glutinosa TaxID=7769 RepID=UPI00358F5E72